MSTLRVNTLQDATGSDQPAMVGAAKAWVNFNGTGTVAIRAAFNVSSITDNGTGTYVVNFTNALSNANYSAVFSTSTSSGSTVVSAIMNNQAGIVTPTTTTLALAVFARSDATARDSEHCCLSIFR